MAASYQLNNAGVVFLEKGDLQGALRSFLRALKETNGSLEETTTVNTTDTDKHWIHHKETWSFSPPQQLIVSAEVPTAAQEGEIPLSRGMRIIETGCFYNTSDTVAMQHLVIATITYNIALTYNIIGIQQSTLKHQQQQELLYKAHVLYARAFNVLNIENYQNYHPMPAILVMSIFNNMGLLSLHLGDNEACQSYFQRGSRYAMSVQPSEQQHTLTSPTASEQSCSLLQRHKLHFLSTALLLLSFQRAAAAA